jgi:hypothetical protein
MLYMLLPRGVTRNEIRISDWIYWTLTLVNTNTYDSRTELHTPKMTAGTHINSSQSSLAFAW